MALNELVIYRRLFDLSSPVPLSHRREEGHSSSTCFTFFILSPLLLGEGTKGRGQC
jgi:hypothetical protein